MTDDETVREYYERSIRDSEADLARLEVEPFSDPDAQALHVETNRVIIEHARYQLGQIDAAEAAEA